jgi:hypothetical protein
MVWQAATVCQWLENCLLKTPLPGNLHASQPARPEQLSE